MCGIAGIVDFDGGVVDESLLGRMCEAIRHRGPDDNGIVRLGGKTLDQGDASVGLGSRRLSIIDIAQGQQPMTNENRTVWVVFNGEIYNFAELRQVLEQAGHTFSTHSDTEVIVHAYEEYGDAFPAVLDGMFGFAVWDVRRQRLLLGRDRFGKKPLVYAEFGSRVLFASELQSLLSAPEVPREIDFEAMGAYLAYMAIPAPLTIYRHVRKVPPGHVLIHDRQGTRIERYWSLDFHSKTTDDPRDAVQRVRELFTDAVRKRLVSEVPLGAFLSGGVDSSAVVATMANLSDTPVKTFSIGFDEPGYDELPHARRVAQAFGCEHHELVVRADAIEMLPSLVRHFGEPFADSSAIPTSYLAALTREHVTVALNGDGGDELFAGYGRHMASRWVETWQRVPVPLWGWLAKVADRMAGQAADARRPLARLARVMRGAAAERSVRYRHWVGVFDPELLACLGGDSLPDIDPVKGQFAEVTDLDAVDAMLAVDTAYYLPTDLLAKVDIASMMHSLEARSPFLDHKLAEYVASLPSNLKIRGFLSKAILKDALKGLVPAENLKRNKRGFAVPVARWFKADLREFLNDHLRPSRLASAGLVRQSVIDELITKHQSGAADYGHHLWSLLMLELWHRAFMGGDSVRDNQPGMFPDTIRTPQVT